MNENFLNSFFELNEIIARQSFNQRIQFLLENNLSNSQMMSLFYLLHNQKVSLNALTVHLGISSPAVSQLIEKLVRSGLVERIPNQDDRRGKLLKLTDKGKTLVLQAKFSHHQTALDLVNSLTEEELPLIQKAIDILLGKLTPDSSQINNPL